jgi:hypothetical protein
MIKPILITLKGLDSTKKAFLAVRSNLGKVGKSVEALKKKFPKLTSIVSATFGMMKAVIGKVVKIVLGLGAAFGAAFTAITISTMRSIDNLGNFSSKIGTSAGSLAKLQFAAQQTGVETNTMNMALQRFTRRTAEAAKGTGEAKGALKELNLDAKALLKLPLEDQILELSKAFQTVTDPADKVRLAMKLFDSEGVALVNTLGLGSEALKAMFADAEQLGLVLSEDAVGGVEDSVDAFGRLKTLITGFSRQAVASFAPAIKAISDELVELGLKAADGDVSKIGDIIAKGTIDAFIKIVEVIAGIANALQTMAFKVQSVYRKFFDSEETKKKKKELKELNTELHRLGAGEMSRGKGNTELEAKLDRRIQLEKELSELQAGPQAPVPFDESGLVASLERIRDSVGQVKDEAVKPLMDEIVTLGSQNWFEKLVAGALDFKDKVGGAFKNVKDQVFDFDSDLNGLVTGSVDAMVQGFTDMMSGAKSFKDAMKDMAKSIIDSLMKMYVKYMIVQPLFDHMFPGARAGSVKAPPKALGGPVQGNTPYLVGERGPELFVPNSGGNIIPNNKMGGGGGNVVVNQTINVTTGVQQTVRAEIATLMPQIANAAKGAVADARQRGGGFSKALVGA